MSKKALEHVDSRDLEAEQLWRREVDPEELPPEVAARLEAAAAAPENRVTRPHKDTRHWCKGKVGREHTPAIEMPPNAYRQDCGWITWNEVPWYSCHHVELCTTCGKHLRLSYGWLRTEPRNLQPEECPAYAPRVATEE